MDPSSAIGLLLAWAAVVTAFLIEGGHLRGLVNFSAALIVIGGSLGATMLSMPLRRTLAIPSLLRRVFFPPRADAASLIDMLVHLAAKARREGVLSLEADVGIASDDFVEKALRLIIDGSDPQVVRETLQAELHTRDREDEAGAEVFRTMGGYSPTLGIIGTVMGLIHMLAQLSEPGAMGPAIAAAFMATFYGVSLANLVLLPFADKLGTQNGEASQRRQVVVEGVLGIQAGANPTALQDRLRSLLAPAAAAKRARTEKPAAARAAPREAETLGQNA